MASPTLRHYQLTSAIAASTYTNLTGAVPAGRALVVGKLVLANIVTTGPVVVYTTIQTATPSGTNVQHIVNGTSLYLGEPYVETNLVLLAGESLWVYCTTAAGLAANAFGEEVDN